VEAARTRGVVDAGVRRPWHPGPGWCPGGHRGGPLVRQLPVCLRGRSPCPPASSPASSAN
jgi:hypothetical protein